MDDYSNRTFGLRSQDRDDRASLEWTNHYGQDVVLREARSEDPVILEKDWTLPMLRSMNQAYVVMQRFYGGCGYTETYNPPVQVHLVGCGDLEWVNVFLSLDDRGATIDWEWWD